MIGHQWPLVDLTRKILDWFSSDVFLCIATQDFKGKQFLRGLIELLLFI